MGIRIGIVSRTILVMVESVKNWSGRGGLIKCISRAPSAYYVFVNIYLYIFTEKVPRVKGNRWSATNDQNPHFASFLYRSKEYDFLAVGRPG
jgi:hypothetical protein